MIPPTGRLPWLALVLGILLLAAAPLAEAGLQPTPSHLEYIRVHTIPGPDNPTIDLNRDIHFCDFFSQDTLLPGTRDGLADLSFYETHYTARPSPGAPISFIHAGPGSVSCLTASPFPRAPLAPTSTLYNPLAGQLADLFLAQSPPVLLRGNGLFAVGSSLASTLSSVVVSAFPHGQDAPAVWALVKFFAGHPTYIAVQVLGPDPEHDYSKADTFPQLKNIRGAIAVDIDADGHAEALIASQHEDHPGQGYCLTLLSDFLGASFCQERILAVLPPGFLPGGMVVGDFDGDGNASDIVVLPGLGSANAPALFFLLSGNQFAQPVVIDLADFYRGSPPGTWTGELFKATAARVTSPDHHDLIIAGGRRVLVLTGPRDAAAEAPASPMTLNAIDYFALVPDAPSGRWVGLASGDYDGDGHLDIALAHDSDPSAIRLYSLHSAAPTCLCGPKAQCIHQGGPHVHPACTCALAHRQLLNTYFPCEACLAGFFLGDSARRPAPAHWASP